MPSVVVEVLRVGGVAGVGGVTVAGPVTGVGVGSVTVAEMYEAAGLPGRELEVPAWVVRWTQDTRPPREA